MYKIITAIFATFAGFIGIFNDIGDFKNNIKSHIYPEHTYELLLSNINYKVKYEYKNSNKIIKLNGDDIFKQFKKEYHSYKYSTSQAKRIFKEYFESYYEKNPKINFEKIQKNTKIDLLNYNNFKKYKSLSTAFNKIKKEKSENAKFGFLNFVYK